MKNVIKTLGLVVIAVAAFTFALTACDNGGGPSPDPDLEVKERSTTINLFEGKTATVTGVFDKAGLESAAGKIETAITGRYNSAGEATKENIITVLSRDVTIIVEKTSSGYTRWKTTGDGKTMYLAFDALDDNLQTSVAYALARMNTYSAEADGTPVPGTTPEKVTVTFRKILVSLETRLVGLVTVTSCLDKPVKLYDIIGRR
jgi:hypothetical protein